MPYLVDACPLPGDPVRFVIGNWPEHAGVVLCGVCRVVRNVSIVTSRCVKCDTYTPTDDEFWDYAPSIPYFDGSSVEPLVDGLLDADGNPMLFMPVSTLNVGTLGRPIDGRTPWKERDTMEMAIFVMALLAFAGEYGIPEAQLLRYYNIDVPFSKMSGRSVSWPIYQDIRAQIIARAGQPGPPFEVTERLAADL